LTGRRAVGITLLLFDGIALVALPVFPIWFPDSLLEALVTPAGLVSLFGINLLVVPYRAVAAADSFLSRRGRTAARRDLSVVHGARDPFWLSDGAMRE
jgi:hypothetical protein